MIDFPNMARLRNCQPPVLRRSVPDSWSPVPMPGPLQGWKREDGLVVAVSRDQSEAGSWWLHVSVSRHNRLPSWEDLKDVKELFCGRQAYAVQVFPPDRDYVNLYRFCLHLWSPEEE